MTVEVEYFKIIKASGDVYILKQDVTKLSYSFKIDGEEIDALSYYSVRYISTVSEISITEEEYENELFMLELAK